MLLRGVNIGGHRVFRPSSLPAQLPGLGLINIGAAGTFVVRRRIGQAALRKALAARLPFNTLIVIRRGDQIRALLAQNVWAGQPLRPDTTRFVSVLSRRPTVAPLLPMEFRHGRRWLVKLVRQVDGFVVGLYRRHMRTIECLGRMDRVFGAPVTSRSWSTFQLIAKALDEASGRATTAPGRVR